MYLLICLCSPVRPVRERVGRRSIEREVGGFCSCAIHKRKAFRGASMQAHLHPADPMEALPSSRVTAAGQSVEGEDTEKGGGMGGRPAVERIMKEVKAHQVGYGTYI